MSYALNKKDLFQDDPDLAAAWAKASANAEQHAQKLRTARLSKVSVSNAVNNSPEPAYQTRDKRGDWTVLSYLGWGVRRPDTGHVYTKEQHWYDCQCFCGHQEVRSQQQLRDKRRLWCVHI